MSGAAAGKTPPNCRPRFAFRSVTRRRNARWRFRPRPSCISAPRPNVPGPKYRRIASPNWPMDRTMAKHFSRKSSDGFILVAVLWILGGLALLATIYMIYVVNAATSLQVNNDRIQAEASISAATELAAYYLGAASAEERPTGGAFNFRVGSTDVAVGFRSEAARIDLNSAPQPLLAGLFTVLGASPDAASNYADRIVGWRTAATSEIEDQDKEVTAYRNAGLNYKPRQSPFTSVQELWLVLGLPKNLIAQALPLVTVFSGDAAVNIMEA